MEEMDEMDEMKGIKQKLKDESGVTLIEVIIASALTVILMAAAFGVLDSSIKGYNIQVAQADTQAEAQKAITQIERELRQAEKPLLFVSSTPGVYELLVFKADLDDNGTSEAIMYEYSRTTKKLTRKVNLNGDYNFSTAPPGVLASDIVNSSSLPVFAFYNDSLGWMNPSSPSADVINNVRVIRVRLYIDKDTTKAPKAVDLRTNIKLRNFHY